MTFERREPIERERDAKGNGKMEEEKGKKRTRGGNKREESAIVETKKKKRDKIWNMGNVVAALSLISISDFVDRVGDGPLENGARK